MGTGWQDKMASNRQPVECEGSRSLNRPKAPFLTKMPFVADMAPHGRLGTFDSLGRSTPRTTHSLKSTPFYPISPGDKEVIKSKKSMFLGGTRVKKSVICDFIISKPLIKSTKQGLF
jgi:hypothetical protein